MNMVKGLNDFCKKHRIVVPVGDKFSLLDFLLEVSKRSVSLAEYRGQVTEIIQRLGNESQEWGGCPNCGTNVHLGLKECPVCGKSLDFVDPEIEADDLSDLDPDYAKPKKAKSSDDLDDFDTDDELGSDDEEDFDDEPEEETEEESDEDESSEEDDESEEVDEIDEVEETDQEEEEDSDDESLDEDSEHEDDDIEEDQEDVEPLSGPKKALSNGRPFLSKKSINPKPTTSHAEKYAEREVRRKKLESLIPKFKKDPNLIMKLKYRDLLIMPGLLGYMRKPTAIGSKDDIQRWIKNALKGGLKK